jgi:hypothetical protein
VPVFWFWLGSAYDVLAGTFAALAVRIIRPFAKEMPSFWKRAWPSGGPPSDQVQIGSLSRSSGWSNSSASMSLKPGYLSTEPVSALQ